MLQNLNPKERSYAQDALQAENLCLTKCNLYADQCQNQALKSLLYEHMSVKRQHADNLKQILGQGSRNRSGRHNPQNQPYKQSYH